MSCVKFSYQALTYNLSRLYR